jgi:NAD(P)-dependent dehydrogenase (short-subunit alcohol dehydrogenase family)
MPPVRQQSLDRLMPLVSRAEFINSTVLVVGGSRGLGEIAAKLIAAGGGNVVITYAAGRNEAEAVAQEVRGAGLSCATGAYDVRRPAAEQLAELKVAPTHLYYFATPTIFRRKAGIFDAERFAEFNNFYLTAFFDLVQKCAQLRPEGIRVFYPSSSALDARPANMTEYSMSKAAAEVLCADVSKFVSGVQIVSRRLPRLPTDQTTSIVSVKTPDPVEVMLPIIREMHQR